MVKIDTSIVVLASSLNSLRSSRLQVVSRSNNDHRMGFVVQCHHRLEWFRSAGSQTLASRRQQATLLTPVAISPSCYSHRQEQHPGCHMFRSRYHEYVAGELRAFWQTNKQQGKQLIYVFLTGPRCQSSRSHLQERPSRSHKG